MQFVVNTYSSDDTSWLTPPHPDFWCSLQSADGTIVAKCEVHITGKGQKWWAPKSPHLVRYYITDLYVHPDYRGNGYSGLLLLNVMYHFDRLRPADQDMIFDIAAERYNYAAIRAYSKIFGEPTYGRGVHGLAYFSTEKIK